MDSFQQALLEAAVLPPTHESFCRVCLRSAGPQPLIAPCACTGNRQYVHRDCLDAERTNITNPSLLYKCDSCKNDYRLLPSQVSSATSRRIKFYKYVLRDFLVVFLVLQMCIVLCGMLVKAVDSASAYCLPECQPDERIPSEPCTKCPPLKTLIFPRSMDDHERITYYLSGIVVLLAMVGVCGCMSRALGCVPLDDDQSFSQGYRRRRSCTCCAPSSHSYNTYPGHCDAFCCCDCACDASTSSDCECCNCKQDGNDSRVIIVIVVLVLVFAIVGIFYGIVLMTALFQRIVQRHIHHLELNIIARDFPVADLVEPLDEHIPYAQVLEEVRELV